MRCLLTKAPGAKDRALSALAVAAMIVVASSAFAEGSRGYRVVQTVPAAGGRLEILEDARLTRDLAREMWISGIDPDLVLGENDPAAVQFRTRPPASARLRLIDVAGKVVAEVVPEAGAPLARIETRRFGAGPGSIYLVTTDDDAGFGSYSGRVTSLYRIAGRMLQPVRAVDSRGRSTRIVLAATLKSAWKVVDADPEHMVIAQLLCRPDLAHETPGQTPPFLLSFITYRSEGPSWRVTTRVRPGFWEADEAWPAPG